MISFGDIKSIADVLKEAGKIKQYRQILKFQQDLQDLQNENIGLKTKNKELNEKLKIKGKIKYKDPFYWLENHDIEDGPFCSACWDSKKELSRIPSYNKGNWKIECPVCHNKYEDPNYKDHGPVL